MYDIYVGILPWYIVYLCVGYVVGCYRNNDIFCLFYFVEYLVGRCLGNEIVVQYIECYCHMSCDLRYHLKVLICISSSRVCVVSKFTFCFIINCSVILSIWTDTSYNFVHHIVNDHNFIVLVCMRSCC